MKMAGGIIALIAGIFGVIAAVVTLFFGGLGAAVGAQGGNTVIGLGWGGLIFSFLTIVLGAIAMGVRSRVPGILLIISAILGAILGGTLVAICMALALIGGLLAVAGAKAAPAVQQGTDAAVTGQATKGGGGAKIALVIVGTLVVVFVGLALIGYFFAPKKAGSSDAANQTASTSASESTDPITQLANAQPADIDPVALGKLFALGSDNTDVQRDAAFQQVKGKVVQWTLEVYDVHKDGDTNFKIQTQAGQDGNAETFAYITPRNDADRQTIMALKTGDKITIKGVITDTTMRNFDLQPAILVTPGGSQSVAGASPTNQSLDSKGADPAAAGTVAAQPVGNPDQHAECVNQYHNRTAADMSEAAAADWRVKCPEWALPAAWEAALEANPQMPKWAQEEGRWYVENKLGIEFEGTKNANGLMLKTRTSSITIFLGNNCDMSSKELGTGKWSWTNAGWSIQFEDNGTKKGLFFSGEIDIDNNNGCEEASQ